jgi:hypothetical protein
LPLPAAGRGGHGTIIPITVGVDFGNPEFRSGFRNSEILAFHMPMPEASMHENDTAEFGQDDVGASEKTRHMKPIPEARRMKPLPQDHFRLCILRTDASHHLGSR